jgi:hypothetical protein
VNGIFDLIPMFTRGDENDKHKKTHQNVDGLLSVAGTGLEPVTFGL